MYSDCSMISEKKLPTFWYVNPKVVSTEFFANKKELVNTNTQKKSKLCGYRQIVSANVWIMTSRAQGTVEQHQDLYFYMHATTYTRCMDIGHWSYKPRTNHARKISPLLIKRPNWSERLIDAYSIICQHIHAWIFNKAKTNLTKVVRLFIRKF